MTRLLLEMRGISKSYGDVRANRGIDLDVPYGAIVGLLGENGSGKSTLMKILFGMTPPDAGGIVFKGREFTPLRPAEALRAGIGMIHQHFTLVDAMTVAENVMLGWEPAGRWLRRSEVAARIRQASAAYGLSVEPDQVVGSLPLGMKQRVEIVKAILRGAELLILDEPTSILSPPEVAGLLEVLRRLRGEGRSVIFITHKLAEVLDVCDRIVVLRDGTVTGSVAAAEASREVLVRMMVGRELSSSPPERPAAAERPVRVRVESLHAADAAGAARLNGATLELRAGEVLALAGVDGNGQTELANAIAGLGTILAGRVLLDGKDVARASPLARLRAGIAYIPADRQGTSLVQTMTVADNLALRDFSRPPLCSGARLDHAAIRSNALERTRRFGVKAAGPDAPVRALSGGNQQKLVLAREIGREPRVLVALQPTWGLDPGATRFVIDEILALRDRGAAILYISAELDEVMEVGDRIGVIFGGRIVGVFPRREAERQRIGTLMAGSVPEAEPLAA
jgi:simple sugar transport system ATP-binding protein